MHLSNFRVERLKFGKSDSTNHTPPRVSKMNRKAKISLEMFGRRWVERHGEGGQAREELLATGLVRKCCAES